MKINWGTKLAFFAILFMVFVVSMVVVISRQDMPLVEDDYYEKGLNYQKEIDNNANMDSLITMDIVRIGNGPIEGDISLAIEKKSLGKIEEAELYFYRPSDPNLDHHKKFSLLPESRMVLPLKDLAAGKWQIELTWMDAGKKYEIKKEFDR
jgi:hypothetical protein